MSALPEIRDGALGALLPVRAQPRARHEGVDGVHAGALKVALRAPPVEGAANQALTALLAKLMGVPKGSVTVARGQTGRTKTVCFATLDAAALRDKLRHVLEAA